MTSPALRLHDATLDTEPLAKSCSDGSPTGLSSDRFQYARSPLSSVAIIMARTMQKYWQHEVAKTKQVVGERINQTFRKIVKGRPTDCCMKTVCGRFDRDAANEANLRYDECLPHKMNVDTQADSQCPVQNLKDAWPQF